MVQTTIPANTTLVIDDPWIRVLTAPMEDDAIDNNADKQVGSAFKVDVEVEGVKI